MLGQFTIGFLYGLPIGQVVGVAVAVVFKTAKIGHEAMGIGAVAPRVPAQRALARHLLDDLHPQAHVFTLGGLVQVLVGDPTPAVAGNFMPKGFEGSGQFGMPLQGHADAKYGER